MTIRKRTLAGLGAIAVCLVASSSALAWTRMDERPPRLGYYTDTAPLAGGINFVAPRPYGRPTPWTPEWFRYCSRRYSTFNPKTGDYRAADGHLRLCR